MPRNPVSRLLPARRSSGARNLLNHLVGLWGILLTALLLLTAAPAWAANQAPIHTISGATTGLNGPYGLAVLADGSLAVSNLDGNSVTIYATDAAGNWALQHTISGVSTQLNGPSGLAVLAGGSLAVSNFLGDSVTIYAKDAAGDGAPLRTIKGASTELNAHGGWRCWQTVRWR